MQTLVEEAARCVSASQGRQQSEGERGVVMPQVDRGGQHFRKEQGPGSGNGAT